MNRLVRELYNWIQINKDKNEGIKKFKNPLPR